MFYCLTLILRHIQWTYPICTVRPEKEARAFPLYSPTSENRILTIQNLSGNRTNALSRNQVPFKPIHFCFNKPNLSELWIPNVLIAPLWKSGGYTGFALSFQILWFCHSVLVSFCHNFSNEAWISLRPAGQSWSNFTLSKSSNRSPGNFSILAKISNIQKITLFRRKVYYIRSDLSNFHFDRAVYSLSIAIKTWVS